MTWKVLDAIDYWLAPLWVLALFGLTSFGWAWLAQFAAAYFAWTLIEYLLHRWVFHNPRFWPIWRGHMSHHKEPRKIQPLRLYTPILIVTLVAIALMWRETTPVIQGLVAGYWGYLMIHMLLHEYEFKIECLGHQRWWLAGAYLGYLQRRHERHHHADATSWFGLHTLLWDHLFGTAEPPYKLDIQRSCRAADKYLAEAPRVRTRLQVGGE